MLVLINKYLRSKDRARSDGDGGNEGMPRESSNGDDGHGMCMPGCVPVRAKRAASSTTTVVTTTTAQASRHDFVRAAASGLLPGARFTNHESLPSLRDAYASTHGARGHHWFSKLNLSASKGEGDDTSPSSGSLLPRQAPIIGRHDDPSAAARWSCISAS